MYSLPSYKITDSSLQIFNKAETCHAFNYINAGMEILGVQHPHYILFFILDTLLVQVFARKDLDGDRLCAIISAAFTDGFMEHRPGNRAVMRDDDFYTVDKI